MKKNTIAARTDIQNAAMLDKLCEALPLNVPMQMTQRQIADRVGETISYVQTTLLALQYVGALNHNTEFLAGKGTRSLWMRTAERNMIDSMFLARGVRLTESWARKTAKEMGGHMRKSPSFQPANPSWGLAQEVKPIVPKIMFEKTQPVIAESDDALRLIESARTYLDGKKQLAAAVKSLAEIGVNVSYSIDSNSELDTVARLLPIIDLKMPAVTTASAKKAALPNGKSAAVKYVSSLNTKSQS